MDSPATGCALVSIRLTVHKEAALFLADVAGVRTRRPFQLPGSRRPNRPASEANSSAVAAV